MDGKPVRPPRTSKCWCRSSSPLMVRAMCLVLATEVSNSASSSSCSATQAGSDPTKQHNQLDSRTETKRRTLLKRLRQEVGTQWVLPILFGTLCSLSLITLPSHSSPNHQAHLASSGAAEIPVLGCLSRSSARSPPQEVVWKHHHGPLGRT